MTIADLIDAVAANRLRITDHADEEMAADGLVLDDVIASLHTGQTLEDYPGDQPYPCCLVLGWTGRNEPVHSVWAYNGDSQWAVLVTVYRPDPGRWVESRRRRL